MRRVVGRSQERCAINTKSRSRTDISALTFITSTPHSYVMLFSYPSSSSSPSLGIEIVFR